MGSKPGEHGEITKDTTGCYISVMQHPLERCQSHGRGDRTTDVLPQGQRRWGKAITCKDSTAVLACVAFLKTKLDLKCFGMRVCNEYIPRAHFMT